MSSTLVEPLPAGTTVPHHVALILDGNRRWARARGLPTLQGHEAGFRATRLVAQAARELGVHTLTLWAFSTDNWNRAAAEVAYLMRLFVKLIRDFRAELHRDQIRFIHLGRQDRLPKKLLALIAELEAETRAYTRYVLNIALDYGGRDEILRAIRQIVAKAVQPEAITEETLAAALDTAGQPHPDPDLVIRTSGEQRTSGYLPWQIAYSEFYWAPECLPDFTPALFRTALLDYSRRHRRFGR